MGRKGLFILLGENTRSEVHPQGVQIGKEKLHCHISDGLDADRPDFREVVGKVLKRFSDVDFNYLDNLSMSSGYNFLLCTHCQTVRSTPFAIYRITPETSGETFIAIGMSIALEKQFEYKIPKILLTANMQDVPSLQRIQSSVRGRFPHGGESTACTHSTGVLAHCQTR